MKNLIKITAIILFTLFSVYAQSNKKELNENYILLLHGGAGYSHLMSDSLQTEYKNAITEALNIGNAILKSGGTALDAVERVIRFLEDDIKFNAGRGATFTSDGTHELDASIMSGIDLSCGAVTGLKHIKNPISLARLVMEKTPHVFLSGEGAEILGKKMGVEFVEQSYFHDSVQYSKWLKSKEQFDKNKKGTVGCVALDRYGNLAAGTSTGGMLNKMPGRVGDSPVISAGTYADNKTCAVSCTGAGELFIKNTVAFNISALLDYKGLTLKDAVNEMVYKRLPEGSGGIIAIDKNGNYSMEFNTPTMFRGAVSNKGILEVKIGK